MGYPKTEGVYNGKSFYKKKQRMIFWDNPMLKMKHPYWTYHEISQSMKGESRSEATSIKDQTIAIQ